MNDYTHSQLVDIAEKWLLNKCGFAFKELTTFAGETPDAIGFRSATSILIECKRSRSDFLADKKKFHRMNPSYGVGEYRFYMCPKGMIKSDELPDKWGLLYVNENGSVRKIVGPKGNSWYDNEFAFYERNIKNEMAMMYSALRRLHLRGAIPLIYESPEFLIK